MRINAALDELAREGNGDVLVFLSGESEIRDTEDAIRARIATARSAGTEVLPLYGRLSAADQHKVFQPSTTPGTRRRIVLATNVAETSLTVPGIKYVIDAGTARITRYSVAVEDPAAADRGDLAGLRQPALRPQRPHQRRHRHPPLLRGGLPRRPEYTEPEILRTNLAAVILQMISLGLGDIAGFPFLQPPDSRGIKDGLDLLAELGAVASDARLAGSTPRADHHQDRQAARAAAHRPAPGAHGDRVRQARRHPRGDGDRRRPEHPGSRGSARSRSARRPTPPTPGSPIRPATSSPC